MMILKRIVLLTRRPDLPLAEFDKHWAGPHAPLICDLPGIVEYVQNPVLRFWSGTGGRRDVDGVVEVRFERNDASRPELHSSEAQRRDELRFIDSLTGFTVVDREIDASPAKLWILSHDTAATDKVRILAATHGLDAHITEPEPGAQLMDRPQLRREATAPATIAVLGGRPDSVDDAFAAVPAAGLGPVRVLLTQSRRIL